MIGSAAQTHDKGFQSTGLEQQVLNLLQELIFTGSFVAAIQQFGASSFSWGIGYDFNAGTKGSTIGFQIAHASGSTVLVESWTGYLNNDSIGGPTLVTWPMTSFIDSKFWGGYEFWASGDTLDRVIATPNVARIFLPPPSQINAQVDQVASYWVGMSPLPGGGGGLIQTGVARDATVNERYNFWWELVGVTPGAEHYTAAECGGGHTYGSARDSVEMQVGQSGGENDGFAVYDINASIVCTASITNVEVPAYAQAMVEAYKVGDAIQQIAQLGSTVSFSNGMVEGVTNTGHKQIVTFNTLYFADTYNYYYLQQSAGIYYNLMDIYSTSVGGPQMTWLTSYYCYNYVNDGQQC
jgi:hypothetical protein